MDESIHKLVAGRYVQVLLECRDLVKALAEQILGPKAPTLIKKIDELHARYGEACWEHLDEVNMTARLFYGEVVAEKLKTEISNLIQQTKKS